MRNQFVLDIHHELIVDNFAGGGGASTGIELALGRSVDIAINHDPEAIAMHKANHPQTEHYCESVWDINPRAVTKGRPVGLAWFSPDCKHFSRAKGAKPVEKKIRGLAWVAIRWAATVKPRVIMLENVPEFLTWGPIGKDNMPCKQRKGQTFDAFVNALKKYGYQVDWRELRASDYGAPTIRKRLFLIARCDGRKIVWPDPTHSDPENKTTLLPWRTAAEIIDWSLPCPSIFDRPKPLAEATCRRIAKGIMKYVVNSTSPFVVTSKHELVSPFISTYYGDKSPGGEMRGVTLNRPLPTQTTENRHAVVFPVLSRVNNVKMQDDNAGQEIHETLNTIDAGCTHFVSVTAFLAKHYTGATGSSLDSPLGTITAVDHHSLVTSHLLKLKSGAHGDKAMAFLTKFYGNEKDGVSIDEPLHTVTSKDRFGLVTVRGENYAIVDIGMRMLAPHELYAAQGFPAGYIIGNNQMQGLSLTKTAQVRMCGNSVCPPISSALVNANVPELGIKSKRLSA